MPLPPDLSKPIFAMMPELADRIMCGQCTFCSKSLTPFRDEISAKEYSISGMCQECQDEVFSMSDEEEENAPW
jgi:hypothetical protein